MATYTPQGKAHRVLEHLAGGDAGFLEVAAHLGCPTRCPEQNRLWHLLGALLRDRLIGGGRQRYYLADAGKDALTALRAGQETCIANTSSVRVFATLKHSEAA